MRETKIYIETGKNPKKSRKQYGYVLECKTRNGIATREGFGETEGTYNQATLEAMAEALERFKEPCKITVHSENTHVLAMIDKNLKSWEESGFQDSKGKPIKNKEEWTKIAKLTEDHEILTVCGEHEYTKWLSKEMRRRAKKGEKADKN